MSSPNPVSNYTKIIKILLDFVLQRPPTTELSILGKGHGGEGGGLKMTDLLSNIKSLKLA